MALGILALGGKTQVGQAGNSQRSEEGMLPYGSPICSKVPGGFLEALHQGHGAIKGSPGQTLGWHRRPALSGPHLEPSRARTLKRREEDREDRPWRGDKGPSWPTRGHGDPQN